MNKGKEICKDELKEKKDEYRWVKEKKYEQINKI